MPIAKLDHYSVRTSDVEKSRVFYCDVVGLEVGPRPDFPFPGAWLYSGSDAVVHLIGIDAAEPKGLAGYLGDRDGAAEGGTGALDHVAFAAKDIDEMRQRLQARGVSFRERDVPGMPLKQIFVIDPNGVTIELNYWS